MDGTPVPAPTAQQPGPARAGDADGPPVRVLVAEDVAVVRETLAALLGLEDDIEVAVTLASGDQILPAALEHHPDVALLDIDLPGTDGLTAAAELARRLPGCRVLILTGLEAPGHLDAALQAGVCGFLLKDGPADELIGAVRAVARSERVIDARLAGQAPGWKKGPPRGGSGTSAISLNKPPS
jgi:two-component system response regulator DesR